MGGTYSGHKASPGPDTSDTAWLDQPGGADFERRRLKWCHAEAIRILRALDGQRALHLNQGHDIADEVLLRVHAKQPRNFARYYREAVRNRYRSLQRREIRERTAEERQASSLQRRGDGARAALDRAEQVFRASAAETCIDVVEERAPDGEIHVDARGMRWVRVWLDGSGGRLGERVYCNSLIEGEPPSVFCAIDERGTVLVPVHALANGFGPRHTKLKRAIESYELLGQLAKYLARRRRPPRWPPEQTKIIEALYRRGLIRPGDPDLRRCQGRTGRLAAAVPSNR